MTSEAERLPLPATLTPAQQEAVDQITAGPRGALIGPFVPLLRAPELMTRLQLVGEYLRYRSVTPPALREMVILLVARDWDQEYEWGHHVGIARAAGLDDDVIDAIAHRSGPCGPAAEVAVWRFVDELVRYHRVDNATYQSVLAVLGEEALVEVLVTVGYYTTLAITMNTAQTAVPAEYERLP
ncbi:carboxymuconolactone decarboxylase family protein [Mycobacterium sp. 236(2023)]|uniref:carboxymuconolactone decarboxylase family protein n=1 Tax=Mycobacterium sp. 236(2023) TaxID=3038163 RepID=UPI00241526EC|nr:carboxymuconolactone decarboxylase family protein [Mycobacterium sp. 236(2023)]MDG4666135.1 carboxymuconolactone decarboxylase family protein [Mycobacterium sp. 236(2023)]